MEALTEFCSTERALLKRTALSGMQTSTDNWSTMAIPPLPNPSSISQHSHHLTDWWMYANHALKTQGDATQIITGQQ